MDRKFWAGVLIGLGLAIVLLFGFRLAHFLRRGSLPRPPELAAAATTEVSQIREWMTIPYVAQAYGIPDDLLFDALDIPQKDNRRKSLIELNNEYFPEQEGFVIMRIQEAVFAFQQQIPLPAMP